MTVPTREAAVAVKRAVFTMGGKGGVGKTAVATALADWYQARAVPVRMLDLDSENKAVGSLNHFYDDASKVDIHTPAGLDVFVDELLAEGGAPVILADMGSGAGQVTGRWFDQMYPEVADLVAFTAIGIITPDPASVDSVLAWASTLQNRARYLIVQNANSVDPDWTYWKDSDEASTFREVFKPAVVQSEFRLAELEHASRQHGLTLAKVASREVSGVPELSKVSLVVRAQSHRRRLFAEFDRVLELLIP